MITNYHQDSETDLHILLLSTDKFILDVYERVFQKCGHKTVTVSQPLKAVQLIQDWAIINPFDLLYVDYNKYKMNRDAFMQQVHDLDNKILIKALPVSFIYKMKKVLDELGK